MTHEDLYDLAIQRAWDDLYQLADCFSPDMWETIFDIYILGFVRGATDIAEARITKEF